MFHLRLPALNQDDKLPYSINFANVINGVMPYPWLSNAAWAISGGKAIGTPVLGAEIHVQANAASDPNSNEANATTGWAASGVPAATLTSDGAAPQVGTYNLKAASAGAGSGRIEYAFTSVVGTWYRLTCGGKRVGALTTLWSAWANVFNSASNQSLALAWTNYIFTFRTTTTAPVIRLYVSGASDDEGHTDNFSLKPITYSSMLQLANFGKTSIAEYATVTLGTINPNFAQCGVAALWDNASNPQNGLIAYHDGTNAVLEKVLAGVPTAIINVATAYTAGRSVKMIVSGANVSLWYGVPGSEVQVGTTQTVSDTAIINNKLHGMFSTSSVNSIGRFGIQRT